MELLKVLAMPFQLASLLFVAISSVLLGLIISAGWITWIISMVAIWLMLVWLTNYALRLIDDVANGVRTASAASGEMLVDPYLDSRCWIHPLLAVSLWLLHDAHPQWPAMPMLLAAALLFPVSLGACVISGHARDALNPAMMLRVARGLGPWYAMVVVFFAACALLGAWLVQHVDPGMMIIASMMLVASLQLLVLSAYAAIGGALYERRLELGFDPRVSPERKAMRLDVERNTRRQHFIDGLYKDLRVRAEQRAITSARQWLGNARPAELAGDVHAILAAGRDWVELREYPYLLQGMLTTLFELRQAGLACTIAETGLAIAPGFTASTETDTAALVEYALDTGRRRTAAQLLDNYLKRSSDGPAPGARLLSLRKRLQPSA